MKRFFLREIKPQGWLKDQLTAQAEGLSGNIDRLWYDVSADSAWLGGKGEAWERGPYYLDGLVPLAFLLDDEKLIEKCRHWVEKILASQRENGFFGPVRSRDWWSRMVALKALCSYYEATEDKRVLSFMKRYFDYQMQELECFPLFMWAKARAAEQLIPLQFYIDQTGDTTVLPLADKLIASMTDWFSFFDNLPYKESARKYLNRTVINVGRKVGAKPDMKKKYGDTPLKEMSKSRILKLNGTGLMRKLMTTHGVNVAMALKYPILSGLFNGNSYTELTQKGIDELHRCHGTATGAFTSDEHLDGPYPHRGTELCTVAEAMYSYEILTELTGDPYFADRLELLAFNAYPATFTADMTGHQYVQQVNQISATVAKRDFFDVDADGNTFGLAPNFGCCAANMHQGFPKFVMNAAYRTENGLALMVYAPFTLKTQYGEKDVEIVLETDYPFGDKAILTFLKAPEKEIELLLRVPALTKLTAEYDGDTIHKDSGTLTLKRKFRDGDKIEISFSAPLTAIKNPDGSVSYKKGALLFATKLFHEKIIYSGEAPFFENGYRTSSKWNLVPVLEDEAPAVRRPLSRYPFDENNPPIEITLPAAEVTNWIEKKHSAPLPKHPKMEASQQKITLVPYGCTRVRVAQYPTIAMTKNEGRR